MHQTPSYTHPYAARTDHEHSGRGLLALALPAAIALALLVGAPLVVVGQTPEQVGDTWGSAELHILGTVQDIREVHVRTTRAAGPDSEHTQRVLTIDIDARQTVRVLFDGEVHDGYAVVATPRGAVTVEVGDTIRARAGLMGEDGRAGFYLTEVRVR